jgi:hypothetical protein
MLAKSIGIVGQFSEPTGHNMVLMPRPKSSAGSGLAIVGFCYNIKIFRAELCLRSSVRLLSFYSFRQPFKRVAALCCISSFH